MWTGVINWATLIGLSALIGGFCGALAHGGRALVLGGILPWFGLLALLLYVTYVTYLTPYEGGGASMWPIAQLFAGSIAAGVGVIAANIVSKHTRRGFRR